MKNSKFASIGKIESAGMLDGPGIRTVIFFNDCLLRCKYCHNPEMWTMQEYNYDEDTLLKKILRNKPFYKNGGGVTLSGGDPLLHNGFLESFLPKLKKEGINVALDTSGVYNKDPSNILKYIDLVILDIKHVEKDEYNKLCRYDMDIFLNFLKLLKKFDNKIWIRQVIIPDETDNLEYLKKLKIFLKDIPNIEKVEFIPYHKMGDIKYETLGINNPYKDKKAMDVVICEDLYKEYKELKEVVQN